MVGLGLSCGGGELHAAPDRGALSLHSGELPMRQVADGRFDTDRGSG